MRIVVYGQPAPQGSKNVLGRTRLGRTILGEASNKTSPWRSDVKGACEKWLDRNPEFEPFGEDVGVIVSMVFTFMRPKSVKRLIRPFPSVPPDLCKLARSTEDAITSSGLWRDDKLVVEYGRLAKVYSGEDKDSLQRPGVLINIEAKPISVITGVWFEASPLELE